MYMVTHNKKPVRNRSIYILAFWVTITFDAWRTAECLLKDFLSEL